MPRHGFPRRADRRPRRPRPELGAQGDDAHDQPRDHQQRPDAEGERRRVGAFLDLTQYVNALPYKKFLSPGHLALAQYKGHYYGVPYLGDLSVLWYNKKLFSQAGLDPNKPPTSFAEMLTDAQKVNALGNGVNGFSFAGDCQGCLGFVMEPHLFAIKNQLIEGPIGHQSINIANNQALTQMLQLYQSIWSQKLAPANSQTDSGPTWGADFEQGKIGLLPGPYGFYPAIKAAGILSDVGIAPLPGPTGSYSTFDGGDDFVIPKAAKNASGAWEFIQWMLQVKQQNQYPDLGYTPVRTDVLTPAYKAKNPYNAVALKALAKGSAPVTTDLRRGLQRAQLAVVPDVHPGGVQGGRPGIAEDRPVRVRAGSPAGAGRRLN